MKKARDRWNLLLMLGVLVVTMCSLPKVDAVKATSLIFRSTTTTTTEATAEVDEGEEADDSPSAPTSNLTGIPQIDYIHDPNLPRELNGYNLSSYPFYETVPPPEEMDFKCDGLHDGFYASVPHKCQVYHHCLFGTRYDFLCANYTAFDQKTFICHFVSEVDCVNSPKYFIRNEALYKSQNETKYESSTTKITTTSTPIPITKKQTTKTTVSDSRQYQTTLSTPSSTTSKPKKVQKVKAVKLDVQHGNEALYKAVSSSTAAPTTTTTTTTTTTPSPPRSRPGSRRRPMRRRRPQYDYYEDDYYPTASDDEDYYEEERNSRRRRKRPRPSQRRPAYDDYEDDRYDRRQEGRTRYEDEEEDDYKDRRNYDRPRKSQGRRPSEERERPVDDRQYDRNRKNKPNDEKRPNSDYDKRPYDDDRRSYDRPRRPYRDEDRPSRDDPPKDEPKYKNERPFRDERPTRERPYRDERPRDNPRNQNERRPYKDEQFYDDEDVIYSDDYKTNNKKSGTTEPTVESLVKPGGGSLYSKPRIPPRIARPVPSNEKEKYKYVTSSTTKGPPVKPQVEEEYYDEYEDDPKIITSTTKQPYRMRDENIEKKASKTNTDRINDRTKSNYETETTKRNSQNGSNNKARRPEPQDSRKYHSSEELSYEDFEEPNPRRVNKGRSDTDGRRSYEKRPSKVEEEYYYDDSDSRLSKQPARDSERRQPVPNKFRDEIVDDERLPQKTERITTTSTTYRPFFHRTKSTEAPTTTTTPPITEPPFKDSDKGEKSESKQPYVRVVKRPFLPSRGGNPYLPRGLQPLGGKNFNKTTTTTSTTTPTTTSTTTTTTTTTTTESALVPDYSYEADYDVKEDKAPHYKDSSSRESSEESQERDRTPTENNYRQNDKRPYTQPEDKRVPFLNTQKYSKDNRGYGVSSAESEKYNPEYTSQEKIKHVYNPNFRPDLKNEPNRYNDYKNPDRLHTFKPSPQISEPYKPTNRPFPQKIPENISIKQNLADSIENDYDVTINDALNPTISNLPPVRNFPSPFIVPVDRDYTFARFRNNYNPDSTGAGSSNYASYQTRSQGNSGGKFNNNQRYVEHNNYREQIGDSVASATDLVNPRVIALRTPQSFYIQHPRYSADETNTGLRPSHVTYRQVEVGDYA